MNDPINPDSTEESPPPESPPVEKVPGQPDEYQTETDSEALPEG